MGTWGIEPWDSDAAADWFDEMFESLDIAGYVARGLEADPIDEPDQIRAAAYVLRCLGRGYIWPIDRLDDDLRKAIAALKATLVPESCMLDNEEIEAQIRGEIAELESRLERGQPE